MSFNPSHYSTKQSLLEQIDKAFKNVNLICREYFEKRSGNFTGNKLQVQRDQYRNFNNYKGSNEFSAGKKPFPTTESIDLVDKDEDNKSEQSYKSQSQKEPSSSSSIEIQSRPQITFQPQPSKPTLPQNSSNNSKKYSMITKTLNNHSIPPLPKPPLSPYFTFYKQKKDLIKNQFPDMSVTQLASAAAKVWKSLSDEQKGPYNRRYFEQKREYEKSMVEYAAKYPNYKEILNKGGMAGGKK